MKAPHQHTKVKYPVSLAICRWAAIPNNILEKPVVIPNPPNIMWIE